MLLEPRGKLGRKFKEMIIQQVPLQLFRPGRQLILACWRLRSVAGKGKT